MDSQTGGANRPLSVSLPALSAGFVLAALWFVGAVALGMFWPEVYQEQGDSNSAEGILALLYLPGFIYWLVCVHRIHKALLELTNSTYPIQPARAVWFHLIPVYGLYWIFKWPSEVVKFINVNAPQIKMKPYLPGILFLIGFSLGGGPGLVLLFGGLRGMVRNIKAVAAAA